MLQKYIFLLIWSEKVKFQHKWCAKIPEGGIPQRHSVNCVLHKMHINNLFNHSIIIKAGLFPSA